jgi:creatinine amidohydrolase/Fe(II)-dependent formamide hydrolase-like protein
MGGHSAGTTGQVQTESPVNFARNTQLAVRGVMGEPVSATARQGFLVFTEIFKDFFRSAAEFQART